MKKHEWWKQLLNSLGLFGWGLCALVPRLLRPCPQPLSPHAQPYLHLQQGCGVDWLSTLSPWGNRLQTYSITAKSRQSCPSLCDPIDCSPPGSPIPRILQARTLEWVAISFSKASKWKVKVKSLSRVQLSATPWTAACQALPSMGFSRQEYWSGVPLPSPTQSLMCSESLCYPQIHMLNSNPQGDGIRRWGLSSGRRLGHEGEALINGISALIKGIWKTFFAPSSLWGHSGKTAFYEPGSRPSSDTRRPGVLISNFQPSELWEINFYCLLVSQSVVFSYSNQTGLRESFRASNHSAIYQAALIYEALF